MSFVLLVYLNTIITAGLYFAFKHITDIIIFVLSLYLQNITKSSFDLSAFVRLQVLQLHCINGASSSLSDE